MNKNEITIIVKSQAGGMWPDAVFNFHQKVRHVLDLALDHFHLDSGQHYEMLLVRGTAQQTLSADESLQDAGVRSGDTLLVRTIGRTIDGAVDRA